MAKILLMTALTPTMQEGVITKWLKKEGDFIYVENILCEVETDKAVMEYESRFSGTILKIFVQEGQKVNLGEKILLLGEKTENISQILKDLEKEDYINKTKEENISNQDILNNPIKSNINEKENNIKISPVARKIASENNVNITHINGSGPQGRIIKIDIQKSILDSKDKHNNLQNPFNQNLYKKRLAISAKRKMIVKRLSDSKFTAPHYYLTLSINMDMILKERQEYNKNLNIENKISINAYLIKFVGEVLKRHPIINSACIDDYIYYFKDINVSIAVAQDDGLITPIIKNVIYKNIIEIEKELKELILKAKSSKLIKSEYENAGITISNLGFFGIENFTAIINPPASSILAIGKIEKTPVFNNEYIQDKKLNQITIQSRMKITMSCDHRVIDGIKGALFLNDLKTTLENPIKLIY